MNILIVDDNPSMRRLLRRAISEFSATIWECADGEESVAKYTQERPDLVLMDICLPGIDGLEATRRIVRSHPDARIIVVTNYDDGDVRMAASKSGARGYVCKQNLLYLGDVIRTVQSQ